MSVVMYFNFSKNTIIELLYANANREICRKDAYRILNRIENETSRYACNNKFWYELIDLEVTRMFNCEDEQYQRETAYTKYFSYSFEQAAENVEWAVTHRWFPNLYEEQQNKSYENR
jgi:hypothetical protein